MLPCRKELGSHANASISDIYLGSLLLKRRRMNRTEMNKIIDNIFKEVTKVRDAGQEEYARDTDNVFANFERVASFTEGTREKVLLTYMIKHIDGLCAYSDGMQSQREDVRGRLTDIIVYCCLLWGMVEDNQTNGWTIASTGESGDLGL